jgi:hypothetical protein
MLVSETNITLWKEKYTFQTALGQLELMMQGW